MQTDNQMENMEQPDELQSEDLQPAEQPADQPAQQPQQPPYQAPQYQQPPYQAPQYQQPQYQQPQYQQPQYQQSQYQYPQYQQPQYQAPQYQAPQYQQPQYQPQYQQPQYQQPQYQKPQYQAPQYQTPQYQPPQYQAPQYQVPRYQPPQYQPPQYQPPQYQQPIHQPPMALKPQNHSVRMAWLPLVLALAALILGPVLESVYFAKAMVCGPWNFMYLKRMLSWGMLLTAAMTAAIPAALILVAKLKSHTAAKVLLAVSIMALVVQLASAVFNYTVVMNGVLAGPIYRFTAKVAGGNLLVKTMHLARSIPHIFRRFHMVNVLMFIRPLIDLLFFVKNILCIVFFAKLAKAPKAEYAALSR